MREWNISTFLFAIVDNQFLVILAKTECRVMRLYCSCCRRRFLEPKESGLCSQLTTPCPRIKPVMFDMSRGTRDKWEIARETLKFHELLGAGQFGEVWRGTWSSATIAMSYPICLARVLPSFQIFSVVPSPFFFWTLSLQSAPQLFCKYIRAGAIKILSPTYLLTLYLS